MNARITVQIDDSDLQRKVAYAIGRLGPAGSRGLMRTIGHAMHRSTMDKFKAQGDGEHPWEPLADSTIERRRDVAKHLHNARTRKTKRGRERSLERASAAAGAIRILQDTGTMRRSVDVDSDAENVAIGTPSLVGLFHQEGTARMPAREFLTVTRADEGRIERLVDRYLERALP